MVPRAMVRICIGTLRIGSCQLNISFRVNSGSFWGSLGFTVGQCVSILAARVLSGSYLI